MKIGRRTLLLQLAGLAPAVAIAGVASEGRATVAPVTSLAAMTRSTFLPLVGETFTFEIDALRSVAVRLASVKTPAKPDPACDAEGTFTLHFETLGDATLAQQTHSVSHPQLGRFALFVSPNDATGRLVEAVFTRV